MEEEKQNHAEWDSALLGRVNRKKAPTLSQIVSKVLEKSKLIKAKAKGDLPGEREYRLISGGDDGVIKWWNLVYEPSLASKEA